MVTVHSQLTDVRVFVMPPAFIMDGCEYVVDKDDGVKIYKYLFQSLFQNLLCGRHFIKFPGIKSSG